MVRYIQDEKERRRIAMACHVDPTSGHMGIKKTVARVKERFTWKGVIKDVEAIVMFSLFVSVCQHHHYLPLCRFVAVIHASESRGR